MGLRLQKRIKLAKGVNLNLSKSGVGISAGVPGVRMGVGPRGTKTTVSVPGTGIRYEKTHGKKAGPAKAKKLPPNHPLSDLTKKEVRTIGKIAKKQAKRKAKAARRGGCLGCCVWVMGMIALPVVLLAMLLL